jgi:CrcB protein
MQNLLIIGIGGFVGACLRYAISSGAAKAFGSQLPYGTLVVNVAGAILIGLVLELSSSTGLISANLRLFLVTGILGGFTTFSAFSYETMALLSEGKYMLGGLNICLNVFLSLLGVVLGKNIVG